MPSERLEECSVWRSLLKNAANSYTIQKDFLLPLRRRNLTHLKDLTDALIFRARKSFRSVKNLQCSGALETSFLRESLDGRREHSAALTSQNPFMPLVSVVGR